MTSLINKNKSLAFFACVLILLCITSSMAIGQEDLTHPDVRPLTIALPTDVPPISYKDGDEVVGLLPDIIKALGDTIGTRLNVYEAHSTRVLNAVKSGKADFAFATSDMDGIRAHFDFIPTTITVTRRMVTTNQCKDVDCYKDLRGKRIIYVSGDPYFAVLQTIPGAILISVPDVNHAMLLLENNDADIFLSRAEAVTKELIRKHGFTNVAMAGLPIEQIPIVFVVNKDQPDILAQIGVSWGKLLERGEVDLIREKWLGESVGSKRWKKYFSYVKYGVLFALGVILLALGWNIILKRQVNRVTQSLKRSEERYRDLIESSPDMIFLVTEHGEIIHANERARTRTMLPIHRTGLNIADLMPADERPEVLAFLQKVYKDSCDKHEFKFETENGLTAEVEIAGRLIQGKGSLALHACLFARDVTERNRMEDELIQAERLGTIGKMAASMAHEINNPLGIILANAEDLFFEKNLSDPIKEGLETIQRNANRAGEITQGLMYLASPKPLPKQRIDLRDVIRDSQALVAPRLKGINFSANLPDSPLLVKGDARSLQQVTVNLILNAVESLDGDGSVTVEVGLKNGPNCSTGRICVKDTGRGIPEEDLPQIFEPFFTSRANGFGLGLYLSRRIIEKHGGAIFAESKPGKGTNIIVELKTCK